MLLTADIRDGIEDTDLDAKELAEAAVFEKWLRAELELANLKTMA